MRRIIPLILLAILIVGFGLAPNRQTATSVRAGATVNKTYAVVVQMAAGASINPVQAKYRLTLLSTSPSENRCLLVPPAGTNLDLLVSDILNEPNVLDAETNSETDSPFIF